MAMTVAELLDEPHLGLSVLAGSEGLQNQITWSHTSDLPRLWEWVTGGELLMTNGMSIPADEQGQIELATSLVRSGASALAIGEKMHAPPLQPEFIETCNRLPLPLLNIPYPLPFIAIARTVADSSLAERSQRLRQTARIYDLLGRAVPLEESHQSLVEGIASALKAQVHVVDRRCLHPWHPGGQALPEEAVEVLEPFLAESTGVPRRFQRLRAGQHYLTVMDLPTHEDALLVLLPRSGTQSDPTTLLHVATVLGLQLSQTALALESQRRLAASFMVEAFEHRTTASDVQRRLDDFGISSEDILVASMSSSDLESLHDIDIRLWRHGWPNVSLRRSGTVQMMISARCAEEVFQHVAPVNTHIGLSRTAQPGDLQHAAQESLWALGVAKHTGHDVVRYADGSSWLGLINVEEGLALVRRILGPVLEHEEGKHPELLITLRAYLTHQCSWTKAATALFVHRQTVVYRMRKISELTGMDISETSTVAQLWFALQIHDAMHP